MAPGYNELKNMNQSVLCRYITRPAIANERLKRNRAGQVVLQLKSPSKDGTPISSWSRWSSWSAWRPWCRGRVYI